MNEKEKQDRKEELDKLIKKHLAGLNDSILRLSNSFMLFIIQDAKVREKEKEIFESVQSITCDAVNYSDSEIKLIQISEVFEILDKVYSETNKYENKKQLIERIKDKLSKIKEKE